MSTASERKFAEFFSQLPISSTDKSRDGTERGDGKGLNSATVMWHWFMRFFTIEFALREFSTSLSHSQVDFNFEITFNYVTQSSRNGRISVELTSSADFFTLITFEKLAKINQTAGGKTAKSHWTSPTRQRTVEKKRNLWCLLCYKLFACLFSYWYRAHKTVEWSRRREKM